MNWGNGTSIQSLIKDSLSDRDSAISSFVKIVDRIETNAAICKPVMELINAELAVKDPFRVYRALDVCSFFKYVISFSFWINWLLIVD